MTDAALGLWVIAAICSPLKPWSPLSARTVTGARRLELEIQELGGAADRHHADARCDAYRDRPAAARPPGNLFERAGLYPAQRRGEPAHDLLRVRHGPDDDVEA